MCRWELWCNFVCVLVPTWASCPKPWYRWSSSAGPGCGWSPAGSHPRPQYHRQHLHPEARRRTDWAPTLLLPYAARCPSAAPGQTCGQTQRQVSHRSTPVKPCVTPQPTVTLTGAHRMRPTLPKFNKEQMLIIDQKRQRVCNCEAEQLKSVSNT